MERSILEEGSSSLATSEDIQKRLVRPTLHSQYSSSCAASPQYPLNSVNEISCPNSSQLDLNSHLQKKSKGVKKINRLEDYLDPVLLSTIRAKIGAKRKRYGVEIEKITKLEQKESDWLEWLGDHRESMAASGSFRRSRSSRAKHQDEILDLKLDSDSTETGADETEEIYCTPFQRFERAAMKQFKP